MVRVSPSTVSAASGELSELMFARRDFVRFQNGMRRVRGFIAMPEGPLTRAPGTRFMGFTRNNAPARLMAFAFRDEDVVLLEWTNRLLRFWRNGALVKSGAVPYELTTPFPADRLSALQSLQSADRIYLTDGRIAPQRLSRFAPANWTIEPTPFTGGPFAPRNLDPSQQVSASGTTGTVTLVATGNIFAAHHVGTLFQMYEINTSDTPYWAADVEANIGDLVYYRDRCYQIVAFDQQKGKTGTAPPGVSRSNPPRIGNDDQVTWAWVSSGNPDSHPDWAPRSMLKQGSRRYLPPPNNITIEVSGFTSNLKGGTRTTGVNPPVHHEGTWLSEEGGCVWEMLHDGNGIVRITGVRHAGMATGIVEKRLPEGLKTTPTYRWAEQAWSHARGWPRAIGGFEQRHIYAGTQTEPRTFWTSVIGGTVDMTSGANDDDGFSYILPPLSQDIGEVRWIAPACEALVIGTSADIQVGRITDGDRAFSRETTRFTSDDATGTAIAAPVIVEGNLVMVSKGRTRLHALLPDQSGRVKAENLTMISRHILGPGCIKIVRQEDPLPIVWGVLQNGELAGLTYTPSQQSVGFHRHDLGGFVEDIEILPSDDGTSQHLWLVVRRTLGGVTCRCIERMEHPFVDLHGALPNLADAWHQVCAIRWQGSSSTTISGLSHLNGETVTAWTNHGAMTGLKVIGGTVTLPRAVTSAIIGLDVTNRQQLDTLDVVTNQPDGGDDGRYRTHRRTGLRLHNSAGGTMQIIGITDGVETPAENAPEPRQILTWNAFEGPTLRNGVVEVAGLKGWDHQLFLRIRPEPGAPLTITARTPTIMITDD